MIFSLLPQRRELTDRLLAAARADRRISAAALVGSAALDRDDEWSDIDVALRLVPGAQPRDVAVGWTQRMYAEHGAVDHTDVWSGSALYRVYLLAGTLQVDLSFWPDAEFAATGPAFRVVFGAANHPRPSAPRDPDAVIGMGWLYALHARSSIARGRGLQALQMLDGVRDQIVALACLRHGLPEQQGRGADDLPRELVASIADTVVRELGTAELTRAFRAAVELLLVEIECGDRERFVRLRDTARELVDSIAP